jgi:hypothetical protein
MLPIFGEKIQKGSIQAISVVRFVVQSFARSIGFDP